jgi:uncharacterized protein YhhL (DUF1145 family)
MQVIWNQASDSFGENKATTFTLFAFLFFNLLFPFRRDLLIVVMV